MKYYLLVDIFIILFMVVVNNVNFVIVGKFTVLNL